MTVSLYIAYCPYYDILYDILLGTNFVSAIRIKEVSAIRRVLKYYINSPSIVRCPEPSINTGSCSYTLCIGSHFKPAPYFLIHKTQMFQFSVIQCPFWILMYVLVCQQLLRCLSEENCPLQYYNSPYGAMKAVRDITPTKPFQVEALHPPSVPMRCLNGSNKGCTACTAVCAAYY